MLVELKRVFLILTITALAYIAHCQDDTTSTSPPTTTSMPTTTTTPATASIPATTITPSTTTIPKDELAVSQTNFATDFYKKIIENHEGNLIASPLNVYLLLLMAGIGAKGQTAQQIQNALRINSLDADNIRQYVEQFQNLKHVKLSLANTMAVSNENSLKPEYLENVSRLFNSTITSVDFGSPDKAAEIINAWCSEQTNDKIKNLIRPDDITPETHLIMLSAIYLKALWRNQFEEEFTKEGEFHLNINQSVKVPMMFQRKYFMWGQHESTDTTFVELPYLNRNLKMTIFLPNEIDGLKKIENNLEALHKGLGNSRRYVEIHLPKFKVENQIDLEEILKNMGMIDMFDGKADFDITNQPISVEKVKQKAFIEVNESGTVAAAITSLGFEARMLPPQPVVFKVDRPFYYIITYAGSLMFQGRVVDPSK